MPMRRLAVGLGSNLAGKAGGMPLGLIASGVKLRQREGAPLDSPRGSRLARVPHFRIARGIPMRRLAVGLSWNLAGTAL